MEAVRLGKTRESISPHEEEQEGKVAIAREDMYFRSNPIKGDITYIY